MIFTFSVSGISGLWKASFKDEKAASSACARPRKDETTSAVLSGMQEGCEEGIAAQLKLLLEHGVAGSNGAGAANNTPGQFCQLGGLMIVADLAKKVGLSTTPCWRLRAWWRR